MPRLKAGSYQEKEATTRKTKAASKKKDPEKIKDPELELLFGEVERKLYKIINIVKYFKNTLFQHFKDKDELVICGQKIIFDYNLLYKRVDNNLLIEKHDFKISIPNTGFFGQNIYQLDLISEFNRYKREVDILDPLDVLVNFKTKHDELFSIKQKGSRGVYFETITKSNINLFITKLDEFLLEYYINPSIGSMSECMCNKYTNYAASWSQYYKHKTYRLIDEKINFSTTTPGLKGSIIFSYNSTKYKVETYLTMNSTSKEFGLYINIYEFIDKVGWVHIFNEDSAQRTFKREVNKLYSKSQFDNKEYHLMVRFAILFIKNFNDYDVGGFIDRNLPKNIEVDKK